ncbi:alpha-ketoglutarate-dependent sulfonate dioxygenase 4 [Botrytis cinerea]
MAVSTTLTQTITSPAWEPITLPAEGAYSLSRHSLRRPRPCQDSAIRGQESDAIIRDLAITISQRGVCVFPGQKNLTVADQKLLCHRLGQLTTRPYTSGLNIHPLNQTELPDGTIDAELTTLAIASTRPKKKLVQQAGFGKKEKKQSHSDGWHTDCSYENIPADYTMLHMKVTPASGGDTLFASAYEAYDLLSPSMAKMLERCQATFMPPGHRPENIVDRMWKGPRGAPENVGPELRATHPAVRTNPVTGWKSLYAMGHHLEAIEGLGDLENRMVLELLERLLVDNHQLQLRVKWEADDLVIWDNRAVYHV